jgi:hypothetical protein
MYSYFEISANERIWIDFQISLQKEGEIMKHLKFGLCFIILISFIIFPLTAFSQAKKDKIVVGMARPLSGPMAQIGDSAFRPIYETWFLR